MSDMIPVEKVAAAALHQVRQAAGCFPQTYHDSDKVAKAKVHLQVAEELLGLIAPPPFVVPGGTAHGTGPIRGADIFCPDAVMVVPLTTAPPPNPAA